MKFDVSLSFFDLVVLHRFFIIALFLITCNVKAQLYIGITGDFGNQVQSTPHDPSIIKSPFSPSGSFLILNQEEIRNNWCLQYGGSLGILGYRIDAAQVDTLLKDPDFYDRYPNYNTLYLSGNLVFGKTVVVKNKSITFFLGGGVTTYLGLFGSSIKSDNSVWDGNSFEKVFEYEMMLSDNKIKGFTDVSIQLNLNFWSSLGFRYRQHFSPGLIGTYHYYHTTDLLQGNLSLTQMSLSIYYMVKISRF